LLDLEAAIIANAKKELNAPPEKPLSPEDKKKQNNYMEELEKEETIINAEVIQGQKEKNILIQNALKEKNKGTDEIASASSNIDQKVLKTALQPQTKANEATIQAAIETLPPNVAELVKEVQVLTTVANSDPNNNHIDAEAEVTSEILTAPASGTVLTDTEIEWARFFFNNKYDSNDTLLNKLMAINGYTSDYEKMIKKNEKFWKPEEKIYAIDKIINYFETIDKSDYFTKNRGAAAIKEDIKEKYKIIEEEVKKEMKERNENTEEVMKGIFKKEEENPFYILKRVKIIRGMTNYLFGKSNIINIKNQEREKKIISEDEKILNNASSIDFFKKLKEKKSKDSISYKDVFNGENNYYGLTPSPHQLIAFMKTRVEDYEIEARKQEWDKEAIDKKLDENLQLYLNNITAPPKFKIGDKVKYISEYISGKNAGDVMEAVYSNGIITTINNPSRDSASDKFCKILYNYTIDGKKYNEKSINPLTTGGRKLRKRKTKKHFSKKCRKTTFKKGYTKTTRKKGYAKTTRKKGYAKKHFSKKCRKTTRKKGYAKTTRKKGYAKTTRKKGYAKTTHKKG